MRALARNLLSALPKLMSPAQCVDHRSFPVTAAGQLWNGRARSVPSPDSLLVPCEQGTPRAARTIGGRRKRVNESSRLTPRTDWHIVRARNECPDRDSIGNRVPSSMKTKPELPPQLCAVCSHRDHWVFSTPGKVMQERQAASQETSSLPSSIRRPGCVGEAGFRVGRHM